MKENNHTGRRQRILNKYMDSKNFEGFEPYEIVELLLYYVISRRDVSRIAMKISEKVNLYEFLNMKEKEIYEEFKISGEFIAFMGKFIRYCIKMEDGEIILDGLREMVSYAERLLAFERREVFYAFPLNKSYKLLKHICITQENSDEILISLRKVIDEIPISECCYIFFAHNHPSGNNIPSEADIIFTENAKEAFNTIGIKVTDHIIISGIRRFFSFKANEICL